MKIDKIDRAKQDNQYNPSWKFINEKRLASRNGLIEGDTKEERPVNWFRVFQGWSTP